MRSIAGYRGALTSLGTDGFGRSEGRASLRDFFEVDAKHIVVATLVDLARDGKVEVASPKKRSRIWGSTPRSRTQRSAVTDCRP